MILESLVTTSDLEGHVNLAPLGCLVDPQCRELMLRPFRPSRTHDNLHATRRATIHVTDDVLLFAHTVCNPNAAAEVFEVRDGGWYILPSACHFFRVEVTEWIDDPLRATAECRLIEQEIRRPFFGFNRAKHAVIEAAILATRTHLLDPPYIHQQLAWLEPWIEKTGGAREIEAWDLVCRTIGSRLASRESPAG